MKLKKASCVLLAALFIFASFACGGESGTKKDDSLQKVLDSGFLVLGLDDGFPPMGFRDGSGEIVGFDIDVAQEVCDRLGVTLVKKSIDWDKKDDELNSGSIDCIWNGFSVTPARSESMCLSDPYMKNELIFVILDTSDVRAIRDLKGKKIGVQSGSTAQEVLESSDLFPQVTVSAYDTVLILVEKLNQKEIDVALIDSVAAYYLIFSNETQQYFLLPDSLDEEEYAVGFRKDDKALRDKVQQILNEMKTDGTLGEISKKWFGSDITTVK